MNEQRIFITGGAGFIGSRLGRALVGAGANVLAYDNLHPQVHGDNPNVDFPFQLVRADIRDRVALRAAVAGFSPTTVVHLAAETGTGQSADEPTRYADVNVVGTAQLIEAMRALPVSPQRVVLAATRAVYGEGAYRSRDGSLFIPAGRSGFDMAAGKFAVYDELGNALEPVPTPERLAPAPASVYGSTKLLQEYLFQQSPGSWRTAALRLQNVYGPGQSLRNPYTGVLSIFCQQAMNGQVLNIYEDGEIFRDFVFVDDVVAAFVAACRCDIPVEGVINVGTGQGTSIVHAARLILSELGLPSDNLRISGMFRSGDIRYAVADNTLAEKVLDWKPEVSFEEGVAKLVSWAKSEAVSANS
jgi:dTDP-L-rhamnose 4-epimerase